MKNEPLLTTATVVAIASASIALLVAFGLPLSGDQIKAITTLITVVSPVALAWFARKKVTPVANPRNNDGEALVTLKDAEEILEVQPH